MNFDTIAFWLLTVSGVMYFVTLVLLLYRVRHSEKPLIWNLWGVAIGILALQSSFKWYLQIMSEPIPSLSLVTEGLSLFVAFCLLCSAILAAPFLRLPKRNRELLDVIEERNVIIHNFHERIAGALRQVQIAMEVGKPIQFIIEQVADLSRILQVFLDDLKAGVLLGNKFEVALKTLVEDLSPDDSFSMTIQVDPAGIEHMSYDLGCELLHIVREAVKNCIQHSEAKKIWVIVKKTETARILEISDKGKGFEVDLVGAQGHGLGNMVTRARKIDARLKVQSQLHKGTTILIEMPFKDELSNVAYHTKPSSSAGKSLHPVGVK
ncbi:MAG: ATP-binding protein [Nitrospirales bacterium]|nr:ATP-binding protein [Nitrospirales bacterium]